jgi:hypothetical protein
MSRKDWSWGTVLVVLTLVAYALLLTMVFNLWDAAISDDGGARSVDLVFGTASVEMSREVALLVLTSALGALGGLVHLSSSLVSYVGNRSFRARWASWYLARPVLGAGMGLVLYLVIRAGFLNLGDNAEDQAINVYGIAAVALLGGIYSKQATAKLQQVFTALFETPAKPDEGLKDKVTSGPSGS